MEVRVEFTKSLSLLLSKDHVEDMLVHYISVFLSLGANQRDCANIVLLTFHSLLAVRDVSEQRAHLLIHSLPRLVRSTFVDTFKEICDIGLKRLNALQSLLVSW